MVLRTATCLAGMLAVVAVYCGAEPAGPAGPAAPGPWIAGLAADEFTDREEASAALARWAESNPAAAIERFFHEAVGHGDPEVRMRCRELLREVVLDEFRRHGQGYVGIQMGRVDIPLEGGKGFGVQVVDVVDGTPAAKAGIKVNDVIVELDGRRWQQPGAADAFQAAVMSRRPGEVVILTVQRPGEALRLDREVKLGRRPEMPNQLLLWQGGVMPDPRQAQRDDEDRHFREWFRRRLDEFKASGR